jgi:hypothetical protein
MTNTKSFRRITGKAVEWKATKFDSFKLVKKGEYRSQTGSARSLAMELAKDGMIVSTWTKKCAEIGIDSNFATNSIQKLMTTKAPGWVFSDKNAEGLTYEAVKGSRSPEKAAAKEKAKAAKDKERAAKAAAKEKAKAAKEKGQARTAKAKAKERTPKVKEQAAAAE